MLDIAVSKHLVWVLVSTLPFQPMMRNCQWALSGHLILAVLTH